MANYHQNATDSIMQSMITQSMSLRQGDFEGFSTREGVHVHPVVWYAPEKYQRKRSFHATRLRHPCT